MHCCLGPPSVQWISRRRTCVSSSVWINIGGRFASLFLHCAQCGKTFTLFVVAYIWKWILCQRGALLEWERSRFLRQRCTQKRAPLTNAALSDITCKMKWKWHQHFLKTVVFHQKYSHIKTPAICYDFETCRAQPSILPTRQPFEFS